MLLSWEKMALPCNEERRSPHRRAMGDSITGPFPLQENGECTSVPANGTFPSFRPAGAPCEGTRRREASARVQDAHRSTPS